MNYSLTRGSKSQRESDDVCNLDIYFLPRILDIIMSHLYIMYDDSGYTAGLVG